MKKIAVGNHVIRMAEMDDIPFIMDFFDKYWEKGCLISRDRAYFEYEHVVDGRVNFVVAAHKETGSIDAVQGLIQCSKKNPHDAFGVLWVCKPKSGTKFLGVALDEHNVEVSGIRGKLVGVGIRAETGVEVLKTFYGIRHTKMNHYYRLAKRDVFSIAVVTAPRRVPGTTSEKKLIPIPTMQHLLDWFDLSTLQDVPMYKDAWYIEHRYFNHPYYRFNIWGIEESPSYVTGLLVGRIVCCKNSSALRIMDFFGPDNALDGIGSELDLIMDAGNIEYTDFYCTEIAHEHLENAGFVLRNDSDPNIIPNHFEPFEQKNVDIFCSPYGFRLFKGDADQGRPKRLRLPAEWNFQGK